MSTSNIPPAYGVPDGPGNQPFQRKISTSSGSKTIPPRSSFWREAISFWMRFVVAWDASRIGVEIGEVEEIEMGKWVTNALDH